MKLSKAQAKAQVELLGVDLTMDFHQQPNDSMLVLQQAYAASRYRAPAARTGSALRYFYEYLTK